MLAAPQQKEEIRKDVAACLSGQKEVCKAVIVRSFLTKDAQVGSGRNLGEGTLHTMTRDPVVGKVRYDGNSWQPCREDNNKDMILARLLADLAWTAVANESVLTHDEFDAALCALTGICAQLKGDGLQQAVAQELSEFGDSFPMPSDYVLLKSIPSNVRVCQKQPIELVMSGI